MERVYISRGNPIAGNPELSHKINSWRLDVEASNSTSPSQCLVPYESVVPSSLSTRPLNPRRRKPYARPPDSPRHQRPGQMDVPDLPILEPMSFMDSRQVRGVQEVTRDNCGHSWSMNNSAWDLPHPEHNPLIASQPDVLAEEYCRLSLIFEKLDGDRRKEEFRWLQTSSKDAMTNLMDLGSNIRRVVDAARYVVKYSKKHGWNVDFDAVAYEAQHGPNARTLIMPPPSRVRELVCHPGIPDNQNSSPEWYLYPAA